MLKLEAWGKEHQIALSVEHYAENGNLAIQMWSFDEGYPEPWSILTVNLSRKCKPNCAFIDTNNNGNEIIDWLEANHLGFDTGVIQISGYYAYSMFEFNMEEVEKHLLVKVKEVIYDGKVIWRADDNE